MLAVLGAVYEPKSKEEQDNRKNESQAKRDTPDTIIDVLVVGCENNECDYSGDHEAQIDGEVCCDRDEHAALATNIGSFVSCFRRTCSAGWVFAWSLSIALIPAMQMENLVTSGAEPSNTTANNHHPKHSQLRRSMGSSRENDTEHEEQRSKENTSPASKLIDGVPEEQHSEDLADKISIAEARLDGAGESLGVQFLEERVHVANDLGIVTV